MRYFLIAVCATTLIEASFANNEALNESMVSGIEAEKMIREGTVMNSFSKDVQYGVKYYYSVLYFGYTWLCEQATYRTTCYLEQ